MKKKKKKKKIKDSKQNRSINLFKYFPLTCLRFICMFVIIIIIF